MRFDSLAKKVVHASEGVGLSCRLWLLVLAESSEHPIFSFLRDLLRFISRIDLRHWLVDQSKHHLLLSLRGSSLSTFSAAHEPFFDFFTLAHHDFCVFLYFKQVLNPRD